ncbi:FxsB family radical SAM/SPASM domain protein [Actinocrinis puniceicyclus]|uniref:FxsB family radical SAM/SPASM domain protein n=1 Tax=Actinocrinis puniceicyclus TaxID=977794 RepID=A0A8J7WPN0_9ACTN|nr:FxsB family cyclophane-forming radical SAM/SPASM peptide maturase [Actinocrinis puniceicyclus]MBS2963240.1 FxsB family radical SAM/SPASM domain protein [Actinocrinis puniceicyclus]
MVAGPAVLPFRHYVLKLHSRCDLACDHCYVYEHADQSWRGRPLALSEEAAARIADRIVEHTVRHTLGRITVVLHGGEPLLYGAERTRALLSLFRERITPYTKLDFRIHTNAVRLDRDFLDLFAEFAVSVGVSLDGDRSANDLHRRYASGRSSHSRVLSALSLLREPRYRHLYAGILCTIDIRNDPGRVYEALAAEQPPRADLLLPHATWDHPPLRGVRRDEHGPPEYAAWLTAVYDRWAKDGRPFAIRTFDSISGILRGRPSQTESLGLAPAALVVIETDGSLEQADSLKTAYDGAGATGFNVFEHSFDQAAAHAGITARQGGAESLCATCRACPVVEICGGGLYAHRHRAGSGFANPSVYCEDIKAMIEHIERDETRRHAEAAIAPHVGSLRDFDLLASGLGGEDEVGRLGAPQRSITRELVKSVGEQVPPRSPFAAAWQELVRLDQSNPAQLGAVLADPYTRVWAVRVLQREHEAPADDELTRLSELAAATALLSGEAVRLPLHVVDGIVHLPTIGALALGGPARPAAIETRKDGTATITADLTDYEICLAEAAVRADARWLPTRSLRAGSWSLAVQDTDPYRDCHQWPAAGRLSDDEARHWEQCLGEAAAFLEESMPAYPPGLRAGLSTLMPLAPPPAGRDLSATARHAYGAVGLAMPGDGPTLALLLIHEFQHIKLNALLDMYDLYDTNDERRYYAPWRDDPRPLEGLLQGTYAHLAVTDYWRVRSRESAAAQREAAEIQFARWRLHTAEAVEELLRSGSLTALGERFARVMGDALAPWLDEPVGHGAAAAAQQAVQADRGAWQARRQANAG